MTSRIRFARLGFIVFFAVGSSLNAAFAPQGPGFTEHSGKWARSARAFHAGEYGTFPAGKGKVVYRIFTRTENTRNIVLFPGFGEAPQKYIELITDFLDRGYNVFALSHRGMGESTRLLKNRQIIHIENPKDYYDDADYFLRKVVAPRTEGQPVYLFSHSAGGLIAAHALANNPGFFDKAVLSAPMLDINLGGYSRFTAWLIAQTRSTESYAPGSEDWSPFRATFEKQTATGSMMRWWFLNQMFRRNRDLWVGGPSTGWVMAMLGETEPAKMEALAKRVTTPVLVFQAGDDTYVLPEAQALFVKHAPKAKLVCFPTARHEIHQERSFIRHQATDALFQFFEN
jgi:lysophospholipase